MVKLKGISQSELEESQRKYPFLEEVIRRARNVPLFKIHEKNIDDSLLDVKSHEFSYDSGYEYDWAYYAVQGNKIHELGMRYSLDYSEPIFPAPTIREALTTLGSTPDFIVGAYYVWKKHNGDSWRDVELTVYKPTE